MNQTESQRLTDIYHKFGAGDHADALEQLRELSKELDDPWERAALNDYEALLLVQMGQIPEARQRLEEFKKSLTLLGELPPDGYQDDPSHNLAVMVPYTEFEVLLAERKQPEALQVLEDLVSRFPKQLSIPGFSTISEELETLHGFLLADAGRWEEAKPFLESASPPQAWKSVLCYYLGHCYYSFEDYERAKKKLTEAITLGLTGHWQGRARYVLGLVEYHLSNMRAAKSQFEECVKTADPVYLGETKIWEWLEATSRALGLRDDAERYRRRRMISPFDCKPN
jgi:tetratricopeptide (TPR) repeat protein